LVCVESILFMGSTGIYVNFGILSKCHSGESLFEYYLQEFQYGKDVFQTTTNKVFTLVNDSKVQRGVNSKL